MEVSNDMHAFEAQKEMISISTQITDTSPLSDKHGRVLVAINVLAAQITSPLDDELRVVRAAKSDEIGDSFVSVEEAEKWLAYVTETLRYQVALFGNFGNPDRLK
jgi:hypothetical protein